MSTPTLEAPAAQTETAVRLPGIEGLRGIAALAVVVYHLQSLLGSSTSALALLKPIALFDEGVTLFFVLSGFLLYRPFAAHLLGLAPRPATGRYFANRMLRIFPAYLLVLLITSLVLQMAWLPRETDGAPIRFGTLNWFDTITAALLLQGTEARSIRSGLEVAWTLTIEVGFYLLLPALSALIGLTLRRFRSPFLPALAAPGALLLLGWCGKLWQQSSFAAAPYAERHDLGWGANWSAVLARSIFVSADLFAYGMIAAVIVVAASQTHRLRAGLHRWSAPLLATAAIIAILLVAHILKGVFTSSWVAVGAAALLLAVVSSGQRSPLRRILDSRTCRWFGQVSFSLYLWHLPVIRWMQLHGFVAPDSPLGFGLNILLIGSITLLLSAATYYLVEVQALKLKKFILPTRNPPRY